MKVRNQLAVTSKSLSTLGLVSIKLKLKCINCLLEDGIMAIGLDSKQNRNGWHEASTRMEMKDLHFCIKLFSIYLVLGWKFEIHVQGICITSPSIGKIGKRRVWF
jgi:hypothetical protein